MREVDGRTKVSRRVFLRGTATAVPAAAMAAAGMSISPDAAWAQDAKTLTPRRWRRWHGWRATSIRTIGSPTSIT